VFKGAGHAFLALLTKQFEVDGAGLLFTVELNPEDDSSLHRRPRIAAVLYTPTVRQQNYFLNKQTNRFTCKLKYR